MSEKIVENDNRDQITISRDGEFIVVTIDELNGAPFIALTPRQTIELAGKLMAFAVDVPVEIKNVP